MPDDEVRTVSGDVLDGPPGPVRPVGADEPAGGLPYPDGIEVRTFRLGGPPGGLGLWLGAGLLALGGYLLLAAWFPVVAAAGSAAVAIVGALLLGAGLTRRLGSWSVYLGALVLAVGAARLAGALGLLPGGGWTTLAIGVALLGLAAYRASRGGGGRTFAIVGGAIAFIGGVQALGGLMPGFPTLGELVLPALLVCIGAFVLAGAFRRG